MPLEIQESAVYNPALGGYGFIRIQAAVPVSRAEQIRLPNLFLSLDNLKTITVLNGTVTGFRRYEPSYESGAGQAPVISPSSPATSEG